LHLRANLHAKKLNIRFAFFLRRCLRLKYIQAFSLKRGESIVLAVSATKKAYAFS